MFTKLSTHKKVHVNYIANALSLSFSKTHSKLYKKL